PSELPFDLGKKRLVLYNAGEGSDLDASRKKLAGKLRYGLREAHLATRAEPPAKEPAVQEAPAKAAQAQELGEARRKYLVVRVGPNMEHQWAVEGRRFQSLLMEKSQAVGLTCAGEPGGVVSVKGAGVSVATTFRPHAAGWRMWCGFTKM